MERRLFVLSVLLVFLFQQTWACDACGCSVNGGGIGLMSAYRYNYIGLQWHHAGFEATPGHGQGAQDGFHTFELAVRYHLSNRFNVLLNQPFNWNIREVEGIKHHIHGISDTRVFANYTLLQNAKIGKEAKLYWEAGAGLKIPLGEFDPNIHDKDLPENFNAGNGSWGYLFQSNMVLNRKKSGMVWTANYQHNGSTNEGYTFGNQFSSQLLFFHEIKIKEALKITPNAGLYSEWVTGDKFANDNAVTGTGGKGLFISTGLQLKKDNWLAGISYAQPIRQNYSHDEVDALGRFSCQVFYIF